MKRYHLIMLQLLIHNARIIDGTGSPWFRGSVLVDQNTLTVKRGELNLVDYESERVIDAAVSYTHLTLPTNREV